MNWTGVEGQICQNGRKKDLEKDLDTLERKI